MALLGASVGTGLGVAVAVVVASVGRRLRARRADIAAPETADQAVDAELRGLAKGLSHDLAGPLRSLGVAIAMVEEDLAAGHVDDALETLAVVRQQTAQLGRMTAGLVGYCRAAWHPVAPRDANLARTVRDTVSSVRTPSGPTVSVVTEDAALHFEVDAFRQVLQAVVDNACRHHSKGADGTVQVRVDIASNAGQLWIQVQVDDDGAGVPDEMHDAVFSIFRRSTSPEPGSGVGLALAQTLTWRCGGDINLGHAEAGGARVSLRWPVVVSELGMLS